MKKLCLLLILLAPYVLSFAQTREDQSVEVKGAYIQMVYVQGGSFMMGAPASETDAEADTRPVHKVTLSDFYIGEYEVTQRIWELVMGDNPSSLLSPDPDNIFMNVPVSDVSWNDCQIFIQKLNALTGCRFRLPTEAEWEYAARGGNRSKGYKYAGSNTYGKVAARRNWEQYSFLGPSTSRYGNEQGIYDMSGNVEEWCQDWYGPYSKTAQVNPKGPKTGSERVFRGGSFYLGDPQRRVWDRAHGSEGIRSTRIGLRLACDVSGMVIKKEEAVVTDSPKPVVPDVSKLDFEKNRISLEIGEETSLKVTVSPPNADRSSIKWSSSNTSVAKVSSSGKVTGVSNGSATITVSAGNLVAAKCEVTVFSYLVPDLVDLGLSVKWGSFNLGASNPEESGRYFAWGETEQKKDYSWDTYKWCKYDGWTLTKYCPNPSYGFNGFSDTKTVLDPEDDAAHVNLGGKWRIPTEEEYQELLAKCKQEWVKVDGVLGVKFTSKVNGNTIFFPAAGCVTEREGLTGDGSGGSYLSSSVLREGGIHKEYCLSLNNRSALDGSALRKDGCLIRPVYGDSKPSTGGDEKKDLSVTAASSGMVDLGLSVLWATCNVGAVVPEEFGNYYAWGETAPKSSYSWASYKWSGGSAQSLTKYCGTNGFGQNGYLDNKTDLDLEDDAARANLGEGWRMPTEQEAKELQENCSWEWTELNKVPGFKVTSLKNGNSIFLPAAGRATNRGQAEVRISLYYWASSLNKAYPHRPDLAGCISQGHGIDSIIPTRCTGCPIRPVFAK